MRRPLIAAFAVLVLLVLSSGCAPVRYVAYFGVETRAPTDEEVLEFGLPLRVRHQGQVVDRVEPGSPAESAGIRVDDVLLSLDQNDLYSLDDVRDFVSTRDPGQIVHVTLKRRGSEEPRIVRAEIGERMFGRDGDAAGSIRWQFSSLVQLDAALRHAKSEGKFLLVGISGAET